MSAKKPGLHGDCIVCGKPVKIGDGRDRRDGDGRQIPFGPYISFHYINCEQRLRDAMPAAIEALKATFTP